MIRTKEELKEYLRCEKEIYSCSSFLRLCPLHVTEKQILYRHAVLLRKTEYHYNRKHTLLFKYYLFRLSRIQNRYALHIPINVFDKGFSIPHVAPVVVNASSRVGRFCGLNMGVNIGEIDGAAPVLGDNVYLGPGAKVFGGITLADGVWVGANAVVNRSCEVKGATLTGIPAKIVKTVPERACARE